MEDVTMQSIGPYQILEEVGRGAMGVVFRGFDPAIGRPVAIKVIKAGESASAMESAELKLRFAREAAAAGKLSHPNIVTIYQLGEHGNMQYLVMELVNGGSLERILLNGKPLDGKTAISILAQVADALDYAHSEGIVHRDVKPGNVLLCADGKIKITDFGIARIASQTMTQTGITFGTPAYMSPEQIMSARVGGQADQFSLGVLAYQILSGRMPFAAETGPGLMHQIISAEPPSVHTVNPTLSARTSEMIGKALAKKPEDRFASCKEFVESLEKSLNAAEAWKQDSAAASSGMQVPIAISEQKSRRSRVALWVATGLVVVTLAMAARVKWPRPNGSVALRAGTTKVNSKDGLTYVWIPPGTFQMGCSIGDDECGDDEKPAHPVTISKGFWMGQSEVTQQAFQKVTGTAPSYFKGAQLPVENVTWDDARSYCQAVGMHLPTEAEWEYAARAGNTRGRYGDLDRIAWYTDNSGGKTHEGGVKQENAWGLSDMLGNVGEWVSDWYEN